MQPSFLQRRNNARKPHLTTIKLYFVLIFFSYISHLSDKKLLYLNRGNTLPGSTTGQPSNCIMNLRSSFTFPPSVKSSRRATYLKCNKTGIILCILCIFFAVWTAKTSLIPVWKTGTKHLDSWLKWCSCCCKKLLTPSAFKSESVLVRITYFENHRITH